MQWAGQQGITAPVLLGGLGLKQAGLHKVWLLRAGSTRPTGRVRIETNEACRLNWGALEAPVLPGG